MPPAVFIVGHVTQMNEEVEEETDMEVILIVVLVLMLAALSYAQYHRGVVRTVSRFTFDEDEKRQPLT